MKRWRSKVFVVVFAILAVAFVYQLISNPTAETNPVKLSSDIVESDTDARLPIQEDMTESDTEGERYNYNKARASYIFEQFDMAPEQYSFALGYELLAYMETEYYTYIRDAMQIPVATVPSFFVDEETVFGVCQDSDAVNYMYEFSKSADDTWELSDIQQLQDIGRYQDIYQSFSDYQAAINAESNSEES